MEKGGKVRRVVGKKQKLEVIFYLNGRIGRGQKLTVRKKRRENIERTGEKKNRRKVKSGFVKWDGYIQRGIWKQELLDRNNVRMGMDNKVWSREYTLEHENLTHPHSYAEFFHIITLHLAL